MTGEVLSAADAHRLGLVSRVVAGDELIKKALETARGLASLPAAVPRAIKQNIAAERCWCRRGTSPTWGALP